MVPDVVANTAAEVHHEVIVAGVVAVTRIRISAGDVRYVEASGSDADASEQVEADFLAQLRLVERIEVGQDRPVGFIAKITCLTRPPRGFDHNSEVTFEADDISSDSKIGSSLFRELPGQ